MTNQKTIRYVGIALLNLFFFVGEIHAFTCPDSTNPEIVSVDCTQMVVRSNKSSVLINNGVTVADGGQSSSYGSVSITYPGAGVNVGTFTNNGTITNANGGTVNTIDIADGSSITNFVNNGNLSLMERSGYSALNVVGSISSLTNNGIIAGSTGASAISVVANGNIGTLVNSANGHINAGSGDPAIYISGGLFSYPANIGTITNLGVIQGIQVQSGGSIGTLNNLQSGLNYSGNLPSTYQVIIHSLSSYGQTTFSNTPASSSTGGQMNFGIGPGSTLLAATSSYTNVLIGLSDPLSLLRTSGTLGGGVTAVNWTLAQNGSNWDLNVTTPQSATAPKVHSSQAGTKQIAAITATYNYAMAGGVNQSLAGGNSLTSAVQSLTTAQVNQFTNAHAEGYSSNMTIGLEQMAHITNSVMDRIHAPKSNSANAKVYQDDQGRYVWADIAAAKGMVNNNNNLAGFGYNLYDLILGMDIHRTKEGGYGVYAGVGGTSMTESQQVTQNFNNTNFYTGIYGAHNFDEQLKLSGALGYMYGSTSANRNTPDIGLFTGGNATSSYNTNGVYGAAKLAKAYQFNDVTISPFIGASYSQLWMGKATEQGGNDFNFVIGAATAYTAVTFAGFDFVYPIVKGVKDPLSLVGFYKFGYDWFANNNGAHSITATSPIYGSFTQVGANMGPISNLFALGLQGQITEGISSRIGIVAAANTYGRQIGGGAEIRVKF